MKKSVYIETTVVSYLTGQPSRNLIVASHQEITREWWQNHLPRFRAVISEFVIQEASGGDRVASKQRLQVLNKFSLLDVTEEVESLANKFIKNGPIPKKKIIDSLHISIATIHGIDYLVTWNCTHIANAEMRADLSFISDEYGFKLPIICTPEELMGEKGL